MLMDLPELEPRIYSLLEAAVDIALNVGNEMGKGKLVELSNVNGSRGLVEWVIKKAQAFDLVFGSVSWDEEEGFGEYIEVIDDYAMRCMRDAGILKEE